MNHSVKKIRAIFKRKIVYKIIVYLLSILLFILPYVSISYGVS